MTPKEFFYIDEKENKVPLNHKLAERQNCTDDDMLNIIDAHTRRIDIFNTMATTSKDDVEKLKALVYIVECIEYELQEYWGFDPNKNYHSWWYKVPHCQCPKIDNGDSMYFGRRIISGYCNIHWIEE